MKKIFRALAEGACEKRFVSKEAKCPEGWFESAQEALAAWVAPKSAAPVEPTEGRRGPGRPRKSED